MIVPDRWEHFVPRFSANIGMLFNELDVVERFAAARRAGFGAIEMGFPYDTPLAGLRAAKDAHGLDMTVTNVPAGDLMKGGPGLAAMPGREDEFKRAVEQACTYASELRPGAVNILAGAPPLDQFSRAQCLEVLAKNAAYAAGELASIGIRAILEAINTRDSPKFLISRTEQSLDVVRRAGHPNLGIEFDIYHMSIMGEDVVDQIARHKSLIGNIQFADDPGRHEPGSGRLDFARIFAGVDQAGWTGYLAAEYRPSGPKTEDSLGWMKPYLNNH
jgi:hydroxypyruvate isomerase